MAEESVGLLGPDGEVTAEITLKWQNSYRKIYLSHWFQMTL
jgi:hypothetical protein